MPGNQNDYNAREKLMAIIMVYEYGFTVAETCFAFNISRRTWYNWEHQLKAAIQPMWGGLGKSKQGDQKNVI